MWFRGFSILVCRGDSTDACVEARQQNDEATSFRTRLANREVIDGWSFDVDLGLQFHGRTFVPVASRELVMTEFHHSRLAVHPGGTKMYHDLRRQYW